MSVPNAATLREHLLASHTLPEDVGHVAAAAGVKTLVLSHISRRSRERDVLAEAQAIFPNSYVARDFDRFSISKDRPVEKIIPERRDHKPPQEDQADDEE